MSQKLLASALNLIFPADIYCIACGNLIDKTRHYGLCDRCLSEIAWIAGKCCAKCGKALEADWADALCFDCGGLAHGFRQGHACAVYEGYVRETVRAMKYKDMPHIAHYIAKIMAMRLAMLAAQAGQSWTRPDLLIPVPMHIIKRERRGYDQAALIARALGKRICVPAYEGWLQRIRRTPVMSGLDRVARRSNLSGAFQLKSGFAEYVRDKAILLVDDVYTTGSTADACAEPLLDAGAASVDLVVFAAGGNMRTG
jgi:ComF family protein